MIWQLKRTAQCAKCPWRQDVNPRDIPDGYCETKHAALAGTIAPKDDTIGHALEILSGKEPLRIMACHETADAHCIGWLTNQIGPGNNVALRMSVRDCLNIGKVRLKGAQHNCFEDTLPRRVRNPRE